MNRFLTSKENIAIELLFEWLGEERINRTMADYIAIAKRIEALAHAVDLHPKVVRKAIQLAFLTPAVTKAILQGTQPPADGAIVHGRSSAVDRTIEKEAVARINQFLPEAEFEQRFFDVNEIEHDHFS